MPNHAPVGDGDRGKSSPKSRLVNLKETRKDKKAAGKQNDDLDLTELAWRELADLQFLDG